MPEFPGRLRTPRLASAPSSPAVGELYYDTAGNVLYYWNGTAWVSGGGGSAEVHVGASAPSPRDDELLWIDTDAAGPVAAGGPLVTSLPAQPVDGQECYYVADATNGVVWHLIYRAADPSSYKWQFVGGSALRGLVEGEQSFANTSYIDAPTPGPSVTVVLAGQYDVDWGANYVYTQTAPGYPIYMALSGAGLTATDADAAQGSVDVANTGYFPLRRRGPRTLTAGTLMVKYRNGAGTALVKDRYLFVQPVRVG